MKVFVYGTLKQGNWNNYLLKDANLEGKFLLKGFKLYYSGRGSGFPVAKKSFLHEKVRGEVYDIGDPETSDKANTILTMLDRLESEGRMYNRECVDEEHDLWTYVGHPDFWKFSEMGLCGILDGAYEWIDVSRI